jgi:hypothetical protein
MNRRWLFRDAYLFADNRKGGQLGAGVRYTHELAHTHEPLLTCWASSGLSKATLSFDCVRVCKPGGSGVFVDSASFRIARETILDEAP